MTLKELREALKDRRPSIVGDATNIHPQTIANVRDGKVLPSYSTFEKLVRYLERNQ